MANGMKSGSGDDPFADVDTDQDEDGDEDSGTDSTAEEPATESTTAETADTSNPDPDATATGTAATDESGASSGSGLPWIYARDSAKSEREMVQFFLQQRTQTLENQAQSDLEPMLGEQPLKLDVREAAYQVALERHLDDVAAKLREWGYDAE